MGRLSTDKSQQYLIRLIICSVLAPINFPDKTESFLSVPTNCTPLIKFAIFLDFPLLIQKRVKQLYTKNKNNKTS